MAENGNPFGNWKHFEELFNGIASAQQGKVPDLGWVDKFIQNVMKQTVPAALGNALKPQQAAPASPAGQLETEVFETHRNVIVRIRIPAQVNPRNLQLFANSSKVKIEGPGKNVQFVRLPALVHSNSSKAEYQDGILQLQLRKKMNSDRFDELYIRFL